MAETLKIGVLALQGAFHEHIVMLNKLENVSATPVRTSAELEGLDGLVLPGGESTAIGLMAERSGVLPKLREIVLKQKIPVFATCAGLIMLANDTLHSKTGGQPLIGGFDVVVDRNHFGSQINSFETEIQLEDSVLENDSKCHGVFIRAPAIVEVKSADVKVLARLTPEVIASAKGTTTSTPTGECIVAAMQGNMIVTSFHPELTPDSRWHQYFISVVKKNCRVE
eukprot:m.138788 g.138788  ORF g.138788 m.138788 type:complete len:225 (-) comp30014_c0_seq3:68-742(-)